MTLNMTHAELLRVSELQQAGFEVVESGIVGQKGPRPTHVCYWRYMRGNRVSALHPFPEAAWRDAISEWDKVQAKVAENPGVYRVSKGNGEADLEVILTKHGFTINDTSWSRGGGAFGGYANKAMTMRHAVAYWAQWNPKEYGEAVMEQSQRINDQMVKSGLSLDMSNVEQLYTSLKTEPLPIAAMKRTLELMGYTFTEVSWGKPSGAFNILHTVEEAVEDAWKHALDNGQNEADMVSVAKGCSMTDADVWWRLNRMFPPYKWDGTGQPPVGTKLWVTPHNTLWGFGLPGTYLCQVLAYRGEYVWLLLLSDMGEETQNGTNNYVTTRTDKVDVKVWKGNNDE